MEQSSIIPSLGITGSTDNMTFDELYQTLNVEQKNALTLLASGQNVFITGNAGTGKSYLIKAFDKYCESKGIALVKTAPTGIASMEIGGATLHSQFGLKVGLDLAKPNKFPDGFQKVDCLLIDEISMVRIDVFDKVMEIVELANEVKKKPIQLVFVGDFYQLPPVLSREDKDILDKHYGTDIGCGFCFQSTYWAKNRIKTMNLETVIRQENQAFCAALDKCKIGDSGCLSFLRENSSPAEIPNAIWVCGKNSTVNKKNEDELQKIEDSRQYESWAEYDGKASKLDKLCDEVFQFKIGARVVMLCNDTEKFLYQNGSLGTVKDVRRDKIFVQIDHGELVEVSRKAFPKYAYTFSGKTVSRKKIGSAFQYPMRLGYAVTVHKSQGQTYSEMNLAPEIFSIGQLYVALSRCKTIEQIYINGYLSKRMVMASSEVNKFYADPDNYSFFKTDEQLLLEDITEHTNSETEQMVTITIPQRHLSSVKALLKSLEST